MTTGAWIIIIGGIIILLNSLLLKEKPDFTSFLTIFILGMIIDLCLLIIFKNFELNHYFSKVLSFTIGFIFMVIGTGSYLQSKLAPHPTDKLMFIIHKLTGFSISISRALCEIFILIIALLLSGPVSFGTIIIAFCIGPSIKFINRKMEIIYDSIA